MEETNAVVRVNSGEVDEVMEKVNHLAELLKEANSLARELASRKITISLNVDM